jgi:hypothetical protein
VRSKASWCIGVATFLLLSFVSPILFGPAACRDGTRSLAIGRQGACSHHGGVYSPGNLIILALAGIAGFGFYISPLGRRLSLPKTKTRDIVKQTIDYKIVAVPEPDITDVKTSRPFNSADSGRFVKSVSIQKCPKCGSNMRRLKARRGYNKGKRFLGCVKFPSCTGTK